MVRSLVWVAILVSIRAAAFAAAPPATPVTAEQTAERCTKTPDLCKALIRKEASRALAAHEACIPKAVSAQDVAARVMHVLDDVLEEDFGLKDANYATLAGQIIAFLWPCGVVS
jgi:hypothetical protein